MEGNGYAAGDGDFDGAPVSFHSCLSGEPSRDHVVQNASYLFMDGAVAGSMWSGNADVF